LDDFRKKGILPVKREGVTNVSDSASLKIVLAEDNADLSESMSLLLRMRGYEVEVAYDGIGAVELATDFLPDVALLDIGMPGLNGYEAAREIRRQMGKRVVLVALTAWGRDSDKRAAAEAGFDHHFVKPVDLQAIEKLLSEVAAGKSL
jgi:CheY-like chemotaxis protein